MTSDPMPVFTIEAKDALAVGTLYHYQRECRVHGLDDQAAEVGKAITEMYEWQNRHLDQVKLPDHEHVPATGEGASS
jgi:hypothetical protein